MSAQDDIDQGIQKIHDSVYVSGAKRTSTYKMGHTADGEYPLVKAFIDGGAEPSPWPRTLMGQGLSLVERGKRAIDTAPLPCEPPLFIPPPTLDMYGPGPACKRDYGGNLQAMVNALPNGGIGYVEAGVYAPIDISAKTSIRLVGLGQPGWHDTGAPMIRSTAANQILCRDRSSGGVKHGGSTIEGFIFRDEHGGGTGFDVYGVNNWNLFNCAFQGRLDRAGIYAHQDKNMSQDNAYNYVTNAKWRTEGPAIVCDFAAVTVWGGVNGGGPNCGFRLLNNTQGCWFLYGKSNHTGQMMYIEGGVNNVYWDFEQYGAEGPQYTIEIVRPGAWPLEGRMNYVRATITDHPWGSGKHVRLGPGTSGNEMDLRIVSDSPNISDSGSGNTIRTRG